MQREYATNDAIAAARSEPLTSDRFARPKHTTRKTAVSPHASIAKNKPEAPDRAQIRDRIGSDRTRQREPKKRRAAGDHRNGCIARTAGKAQRQCDDQNGRHDAEGGQQRAGDAQSKGRTGTEGCGLHEQHRNEGDR